MSQKRPILTAVKRSIVGRSVKRLRQQQLTPINLFGPTISSQSLQTPTGPLLKLLTEISESTVLDLVIEGQADSKPSLLSDIHRHPVTNQLLHVAFKQVDLNVAVSAKVELELIGEAPVVKSGGMLNQQLSEIELEALPTDLPSSIQVDLTLLTAVGESIKVSDLKLPSAVKLLSDPEAVIVAVLESVQEEEEQPAETPTEAETTAQSDDTSEETPAPTQES